MSLRQVLTIYNAERQLNDDETALLNTLRRMTDAERGMFVEGLSDKPQKKASKKSLKKSNLIPCAVCGYSESSIVHKKSSGLSDYHEFQPPASKSRRASGISEQLSSRRQERSNNWRCTYRSDGDSADCGEAQSSLVHDPAGGYAHFHPFQSSSPAPAANTPSPANGGATGSTQSSEASAVSAGAATGGSSE